MKGCILPFPKKGDLGLAKNYRGITLTSIAAKIYNALLRNRIEPKIDNILRKNQNGFRRNRSTTSQILTIRRILEGVRAKKRYINALKNSGFNEEFRYLNENITNEITKENNNYDQKNKNRKGKIIWFNPPFCKLANIDVGKYFLRLIDKHFKQDNILHKIFNRKTLKISYSCTKNISQIINSHNNELINKFRNRVNNNNINSKKNRM